MGNLTWHCYGFEFEPGKEPTSLSHASSYGELNRVVGCSFAFVFPLLLFLLQDLHPVH